MRHRLPLRLLARLTLAAVLLRALVPLGAMPDAQALADGRFALVICTTEGLRTITVDAHGDAKGLAGEEAPEAGTTSGCAWAPCGVAAWQVSEPGSVACPSVAPAPRLALPAIEATLPRLPTGPPLGSRAPPTLHA